MTRAVFLDRDGTINKEVNYLTDIPQIHIDEGVYGALYSLKEKGFLNIIVTNQSAVARGLLTEEKLREINEHFLGLLRHKDRSLIDDIFYSPYHPEGTTEEYRKESYLRKPNTGMIMRAVVKYGIDLNESFFVGDSYTDMLCARNAGLKKILVLTGYGREAADRCRENDVSVEYTASDLPEAAEFILKSV